MNKEVEAYKLFRQLEAKEKRANLYKFYDKDELIDEILKNEDEIERLNNIINELENKIYYLYNYAGLDTSSLKEELQELKGSDK